MWKLSAVTTKDHIWMNSTRPSRPIAHRAVHKSCLLSVIRILVANLVGKYAVIVHRLVSGHPVYTDQAHVRPPCTYSNLPVWPGVATASYWFLWPLQYQQQRCTSSALVISGDARPAQGPPRPLLWYGWQITHTHTRFIFPRIFGRRKISPPQANSDWLHQLQR